MSTDVQYEISEVTSEDFEEWSALFRDYLIFYETSIEEEQYQKTFHRIINKVNGLMALALRATQDGKSRMVGFAHFFTSQNTWSDKELFFLDDLFVHPSSRGQGQGRKLLEAVADIGRKRGYSRVQWVTQPHNTRARSLYDTVGKHLFIEYRMDL